MVQDPTADTRLDFEMKFGRMFNGLETPDQEGVLAAHRQRTCQLIYVALSQWGVIFAALIQMMRFHLSRI